jgi:DNA-binding CsgD family transcriptional regulator/tetratricopeptide (TPR) repeat protein
MPSRAFVGRSEELGALRAGLERAAGGDPTLVLVGGEAGVGKTRLVTELGEHAQSAGARVIVGGCVELAGWPAPMLPVVEALRHAADDLGWGDWLRVVGDARPELARLLPELGPASPAPDSGLAQSRLFELVLGVVRRLADRAPLVWIVEDVHWADASTLDLLAFVVRNLRDDRVLLAVTFRDDEVDRLRQWLSVVGRAGMRLQLERFDRAQLTALLTGIRGAPPSRDLVDRVFARSEGNAFVAEELLAGGGDDAIPATLRDVLLARLADVDEPSRRLIRIAAAIGRRVDHRLLTAVAELPEDELLAALREAVRHRLLVPDADGGGSYGFRHALMREAASAELLPGERERLHARIAEAMTLRPDLGGAAEIAHHWAAANDTSRARAAWAQAASEAFDAFAFADALELFEQVLRVWDAASGLDRAEVLTRAERAATLAGRHDRALELADLAIDEIDDPARAGAMHVRRGWAMWLSGRGTEALASLRTAVRLIPREPATRERADALSKLARVLALSGRHGESSRVATEGLEIARAIDARSLESELLNTLGVAAGYRGRPKEGFASLRASLAVAQNAGDPECLLIAYGNLSSLLGSYCRFEEAISLALEGLDVSRRVGVELSQGIYCLLNAGESLVDIGRWEDADRLIARALDYDLGGLPAAALAMLQADLSVRRGDFEAAEDQLEAARRWGAAGFSIEYRGLLAQVTAHAALHAERRAGARSTVAAMMAEAVEGGEEMTAAMMLSLGLRIEADAAERAGARGRPAEVDAAQAAGASLERAWQELGAALAPDRTPSPEVGAHAASARAERTRLDGASDQGRWAATQAAWDAIGMPHPGAYARRRRAEALLGVRGAREQVAALLAEAHATCVRLGAEPLRADVEALARRARIELARPAAPPPASEPSAAEALGLTAREAEVLELVAEGRTNRQIAETLYISVKTAGAHVSSILRKLGASTRGEAAAVAVRAGLLSQAGSGRRERRTDAVPAAPSARPPKPTRM